MIRQLMVGTLLVTMVWNAKAEDAERYVKAFPPAGQGQSRFVILLPHKERGEDDDFKVEIFVGKVMQTDGVNQVRLGGKIESKPLEGWGFTYYAVEEFGPAASTLIGVPPGTPEVKKFVSMPSLLIPYNSRVPLVIYVPKDGEVRYRIWQASETMKSANQG